MERVETTERALPIGSSEGKNPGQPTRVFDTEPVGKKREITTSYKLVAIVLKVLLKLVPVAWNAAMAAIEINAAISPYSIAVAPLSSRNTLLNILTIGIVGRPFLITHQYCQYPSNVIQINRKIDR